jgi:hypothetical protein
MVEDSVLQKLCEENGQTETDEEHTLLLHASFQHTAEVVTEALWNVKIGSSVNKKKSDSELASLLHYLEHVGDRWLLPIECDAQEEESDGLDCAEVSSSVCNIPSMMHREWRRIVCKAKDDIFVVD